MLLVREGCFVLGDFYVDGIFKNYEIRFFRDCFFCFIEGDVEMGVIIVGIGGDGGKV